MLIVFNPASAVQYTLMFQALAVKNILFTVKNIPAPKWVKCWQRAMDIFLTLNHVSNCPPTQEYIVCIALLNKLDVNF